jgi:hypothetical protein
LIITDNFQEDAESAAKDNGMPGIRIVTVPAEPYYPARLSVEAMRPLAIGVIDKVIEALTRPLAGQEKAPDVTANKSVTETIKVTAENYSAAYEKLNHTFLENRWTDGLPVAPPTREAVAWMLKGTNRSPDELIAQVPMKNGNATIEKIAINAVMAGAKPEYLPVIIAAIEALTDKDYDLKHMQASTGSNTPVIIVNGPIAKELNINSGIGYLGHGWRANSTIGRAVRLCLINLGHVWPTVNDMGLTGRPAAYTNYTFAENENDSPFKPYHVDLGFKPEQSAVTVSSTMWHVRQATGGAVTVQEPMAALQSLAKIIQEMGYPTTARAWVIGKNYVVILDPGFARSLAKMGFTKESIKQWLFEHARIPYAEVTEKERKALKKLVEEKRVTDNILSLDNLRMGGTIPVANGANRIHIIVTGGMPGYSGVFAYPGPGFGHQTKLIRGATLTRAGR